MIFSVNILDLINWAIITLCLVYAFIFFREIYRFFKNANEVLNANKNDVRSIVMDTKSLMKNSERMVADVKKGSDDISEFVVSFLGVFKNLFKIFK